MKSDWYSFYLKGGSVNINCYYKHEQLRKEDADNPCLNDSLHVIRFEVQCKYHKVYTMAQIINKERGIGLYTNATAEILSDLTSKNMIERYYNQIIKPGDYYTLKDAIEKIESEDFRPETEQMLIDTLNMVNRAGIARTRAKLNYAGRAAFYRTLNKLADLGINPVTIPKSYGVKYIPNLLNAFYEMKKYEDYYDYKSVDLFEAVNITQGKGFALVDAEDDCEDIENAIDIDDDLEERLTEELANDVTFA